MSIVLSRRKKFRENSDWNVLPLKHDLNAGNSWGLQYPIIYGYRPELDLWAAWDRHTGEVHAIAVPSLNEHGYDDGAYLVREFSEPDGYMKQANCEEDSIS